MNVSTSLRELQSWDLIRRAPVLGDRRDFFEAETDIWSVVTRIAAGQGGEPIEKRSQVESGPAYY